MQVVLDHKDYESSVSPKGQITLPHEVRERLGIKPKDKITIRVEGEQMQVLSKRLSFLDSYQAIPALAKPLSIDEMRKIMPSEAVKAFSVSHESAGGQSMTT